MGSLCCPDVLLESWGKSRTISVRVVCVLAEVRAGPFWLQLKRVGNTPRWWNLLNFAHVMQVTLDIRGRGKDGLDAEFRDVVFISRTCTHERSTATNSKLGSTKSIPWQNKFVFITKPCYNLIQLQCKAKCFVIVNQSLIHTNTETLFRLMCCLEFEKRLCMEK